MSTENDLIIPGFDENILKDLSFQLVKIGNIIHVKCLGNIDTYNSAYFQKKMDMIFKYGYNKIIFDLAHINYVSSTGIGSFTEFLKTLKKNNGDMCVINPQPKVLEVFQLLGFTTFFNFAQNAEDAVKVLNKNIKVESNFPMTFVCPVCSKKLLAKEPGRFRCPQCKSVLAVSEKKEISLV